MTQLPASIESYLVESGFTPSEITVLKKLIEGEPVTIRELAAKTGKSIGTLDQAIKKLTEKGIVNKQTINATIRYDIASIEAIQDWIELDTKNKHDVLNRKKENFDAFMATVEHEKGRPDMKFFHGLPGMKQAYDRLLEMDEKEWLKFCPADMEPDDNPLQEFEAELFRERRRRNISLRVLCPEGLNGKRVQSKDAFEYRTTRLLEIEEFPVAFTKFIIGDTIASFDFHEQKASFIQFPEFADGQRSMFNTMWRIAGGERGKSVRSEHDKQQEQEAKLETSVLSGMKTFFLSKKSAGVLLGLGVMAGVVTAGLYVNNARLNLERVREKALSIASTAAVQFSASELDQLHTRADARKPIYKNVIMRMRAIRQQNEGVVYMYIMRPTGDASVFEFVADADSLDLDAKIDLNGDGIIDDADWLSPPGEEYDDPEGSFVMIEALKGPRADTKPVTDQWGTWISGHAPICDDQGNPAAVIGVDMNASDVQLLTLETFKPLYYFLGLFVLFVVIRLGAFHQSLAKELFKMSKTKVALKTLAACSGIALLVTLGMYKYTLELMKHEIGQRLMSIAATAAPDIDAKDLEKLRIASDMKKPEYQRVYNKLNEIRDQNENVLYMYIMRPTDIDGMWEFVVDADSNYFLPVLLDVNADGELDQSDETVAPGVRYEVKEAAPIIYKYGLVRPAYDDQFYTDQWGTFLSGYAPVFDANHNAVAIIGLDMDVAAVKSSINTKFKTYIWFFAVFSILFIIRLISLYETSKINTRLIK